MKDMKMTTLYKRKRIFLGEENNMVLRLILINGVIYVLLNLIRVLFLLNMAPETLFLNQVLPEVSLPGTFAQLLTHPWTLLTFMFVHIGFWHIASNMLWLWWFGEILQDFAGHQKVVPVYLYGSWVGALFFLAAFNLFPIFRVEAPHALAYGASAGVMAIAFAATVLVPDYRFFPMLRGGIPIWVVTLIFVVIDLVSIQESNPGGHIAHLGGALAGVLFSIQLKKGRDLGSWMNRIFNRLTHLFDPDLRKKKELSVRQRLFYRHDAPPFRKLDSISQKKIDEILDKINQDGYDSLSGEEKETLMKASHQEDTQA